MVPPKDKDAWPHDEELGAFRFEGAGPADVRAYVERCHREAMAVFATLTDVDLQRRCTTPAGASMPIWKWLRAMVEHEAHHRGQLYMMASMRGLVIPPLYGLTEEEFTHILTTFPLVAESVKQTTLNTYRDLNRVGELPSLRA